MMYKHISHCHVDKEPVWSKKSFRFSIMLHNPNADTKTHTRTHIICMTSQKSHTPPSAVRPTQCLLSSVHLQRFLFDNFTLSQYAHMTPNIQDPTWGEAPFHTCQPCCFKAPLPQACAESDGVNRD